MANPQHIGKAAQIAAANPNATKKVVGAAIDAAAAAPAAAEGAPEQTTVTFSWKPKAFHWWGRLFALNAAWLLILVSIFTFTAAVFLSIYSIICAVITLMLELPFVFNIAWCDGLKMRLAPFEKSFWYRGALNGVMSLFGVRLLKVSYFVS